MNSIKGVLFLKNVDGEMKWVNVNLGNNCLIGPNVVLAGENHVFDNKFTIIQSQGICSIGIVIKDNVWIGANATILDGVTIGKGSVIAAGAVVNKNVAPYSVVGGVPAKLLKKRK